MNMPFSYRVVAVACGLIMAGTAATAEIVVRYHYSDDTLLSMGPYTFEGGKTLHLTVGIGSGAFRHPNDPPNVLWTVGDRGPNIACEEMKHIAGVELSACGAVRNGRVYPTPSYAPSIYRVLLREDGTFRVSDVITLKDRDGHPLSGLLNPLQTAATETALDGRGKRLAPDVNGIDAEGIVRLADGSFWIGEENGPSLAYVAADGRMLVRHVPRGTEGEFAGAQYEVKGFVANLHLRRFVLWSLPVPYGAQRGGTTMASSFQGATFRRR
jgi:Esterase-like activity of phytase